MAKETEEKKKEKRPTAIKRMLQNKKRRLGNKSRKSQIRTAIRVLEEAIAKGDASAIKKELAEVYSVVDKAAKNGVIKKNKANRTKARLTARAVVKI